MPSERKRPILVLDFDGVVHSYTSPFTHAADIPDPPVEGALDFILLASRHFRVMILSSRSSTAEGRSSMADWLDRWWVKHFGPNSILPPVEFPEHKPPAYLSIDDRAITFTGKFPSVDDMFAFWQWQKKGEAQ